MTETHRPEIEYIPPRPAILTIEGREIGVDESPTVFSVEETRSVEIQTNTSGELIIGPRRGATARRWSVVPDMFAAVPIVLATIEEDFPISLLIILTGLLFGLLLLLLRATLRRQRWLRFDRSTGWLVCERRVGFSPKRVTDWELPLHKVVAVQLLYNGSHTMTETTGGDQPSTTVRQFYGYEMNLILDDPERNRVNLYSLSDWQWVRETGNRLAAFLGVPVIDKLHHGG